MGTLVVVVAILAAAASFGATPSTASGSARRSSATTTKVLPERPQAFWKVLSDSRRGVMVDFRNIKVGGVVFRALRLRARTTLLRWHVGAGDPIAWRLAPRDAGSSIDWANEGPAGVVAVFNGAFKQAAKAGGAVVDHVVLEPMLRGYMTIALNRWGHWEMGVWGARNFPTPGFGAVALRQNLAPLVQNGRLTRSALTTNWRFWGDPINENPLTARTGLGVDAKGNLIYVATMTGILAPTLARALVIAGAVSAMQLDINPYWPILGASAAPVHRSATFTHQLPGQEHSSGVYSTGWERDFFVALAQPDSWTCAWASPGLRPTPGPQPQPLRTVGSGCAGAKSLASTSSAHRALP